jgi:hypothetical protein
MHDTDPAEKPMWLFTDLDGTLIPLDASPQNVSDLQELKRFLPKHGIGLVFVTGRHLQSTCQAIEEFALPDPEWIICDVGTTVIDASSSELVPDPDYMNELANRTGGWNAERLVGELKLPRSVRLQETEKQANFKISFYANASELTDIVSEFKQQLKNADAPYGIISSVDPFAAVQHIIAKTAIQRIVPCQPKKRLGTGAAIQRVVSGRAGATGHVGQEHLESCCDVFGI